MFTGIIEALGKVTQVRNEQANAVFHIEAPFVSELIVNQSVAHNGVCLTVTEVGKKEYAVTAVNETLEKTTLGDLKVGSRVNLERCMAANSRFDGHIVQGHVDQTGVCTAVKEAGGSWLFDFEYDPSTGNFTVEKGSVTINGISLTAFNSATGRFRVTIIPHTFQVTTFKDLQAGDRVNLEFDIVGKYVQKLFSMGYEDYLKNQLKNKV